MGESSALDIVRRLRSAAVGTSSESRRSEMVDLDAISTISLVSEAACNVNYMLLEQFVADLGFRRRHELGRAVRVRTPHGALVVLSLLYEDSDYTSRLTYAEFGRLRLSAAFFSEDVAFIREARIVACPFDALNERVMIGTSLQVSFDRGHRDPDRRALPPVA